MKSASGWVSPPGVGAGATEIGFEPLLPPPPPHEASAATRLTISGKR